jgi:hypothetical protein
VFLELHSGFTEQFQEQGHEIQKCRSSHLHRDVRATVAYYTDVLSFSKHFIYGDPPV